MAATSTKYLVQSMGGQLVASQVAKPATIESTEVMIRLKAVAINPADCKMVFEGLRGTSWPLVPGMDGAGVVEAIGDGVKRFAVGDHVLALFTPGDRGASFQEHAVVQEARVARFPATWSFQDAASLAVCYHTAVVGFGVGLRTALPFVQGGPQAGLKPTSLLVLGGSSALGASALQLTRHIAPGCTVLTTSSPKHHAHLTDSLGADKAYDRTSASLAVDIKSATEGGKGVDAIFDAVGAARADKAYFDLFNPDGPRAYAQVWTGDDEIQVPEGIKSVMFRSRDAAGMPGGANIIQALQSLLEQGQYKLPLPVHTLGHGLAGLQKGLDSMQKGVSGEKLVATL